jgi:hypothetical protein
MSLLDAVTSAVLKGCRHKFPGVTMLGLRAIRVAEWPFFKTSFVSALPIALASF